MRINQKELYVPRGAKVQQAAETASRLLEVYGYEDVSELELYKAWINCNELNLLDISNLALMMIADYKKIADEDIFI